MTVKFVAVSVAEPRDDRGGGYTMVVNVNYIRTITALEHGTLIIIDGWSTPFVIGEEMNHFVERLRVIADEPQRVSVGGIVTTREEQ